MQVWALLQWWYVVGWMGELDRQAKRLDRVEDYFSFGNLFRTLFQPFKQIDAGGRRGGLDVKFRALVDRTVSRFIGASARVMLIIIGGLWWLTVSLIGACWMLLWPFLPIAPLVGAVLMVLKAGIFL